MSTTSDRLALLQRTKAGQRALLEGMYPDLDFSTVPFREYGRLFTGRKYVPGFVGGWKTYGRSNAEDPATRDILPDYSGNGRDIRLYNFAFSGMSGWGGYAFSTEDIMFRTVEGNLDTTPSGINVTLTATELSTVYATYIRLPNVLLNTPIKVKVRSGSLRVRMSNEKGLGEDLLALTSEGESGEFTVSQEDIDAGYSLLYIGPYTNIQAGESIAFTFLPTYPGGLVSDGIDDYGQCIKGFSLPDDYTVVAIRRIIEGHDGGFVSKGSTGGAFIFDSTRENIYAACWSYGVKSTGTPMPDLFSYQSKASYNGQEISYGTAEDTAEDQLTVFRHGTQLYCKGVLYDLRIYDHTLTAEELQIVRDEMMTDYENATGGGIADIHYVADWDGKGRSNDEDEPMRSTWTDRATGKVIELHNFGYAGLSGWGGYGIDSSRVVLNGTYDRVDGNVLQFNAIKNAANFLYPVSGMASVSVKIRVEGISRAVASGKAGYLQIYFSVTGGERLRITGDGVHEVDLPVPEGAQWMYLYVAPAVSAPDWLPIDLVTVEILPSYPGALVSDGVDDNGITQEAISEEVGTMVLYGRLIDESVGGYYLLNTSASLSGDGRLYVWRSGDGKYTIGLPNKGVDSLPFVLTRVPQAPATPMYIASSGPGYYSTCIIGRIILIREQLDGAQVEFLKWKVDKEYRDWCRDNGYEYAINQLTE